MGGLLRGSRGSLRRHVANRKTVKLAYPKTTRLPEDNWRPRLVNGQDRCEEIGLTGH